MRLVHKTDELQTLAVDVDLIAVTETWLRPDILDCEILPTNDFSIYRRDRVSRVGGGVMLAVRKSIQTIRRRDLESNSEVLICEIRPNAKRKFLVVFYRPPDSTLECMRELKKSLRLSSQKQFDQIILCRDFNLPHIDWSTGVASTTDNIHTCFTKLVRDNYLSKRSVYNFKKANWNGLNEVLNNTPWDLCFVSGDVDAVLSCWSHFFLTAVQDNVPLCKSLNNYNHAWIDSELLIRKKNRQRNKLRKSGSSHDLTKFKNLLRETKKVMLQKRKEMALKISNSLSENPKRFWSLVKTSTIQTFTPIILRDGLKVVTDAYERVNLLNSFFSSFLVLPRTMPCLIFKVTRVPLNHWQPLIFLSPKYSTLLEISTLVRLVDLTTSQEDYLKKQPK